MSGEDRKSEIVKEHILKNPNQGYMEAVEEIKKNTGINIIPAYYGMIWHDTHGALPTNK